MPNKVQEDLADEFDRTLLKIIRETEITDPDTGEVIKKEPSAAMMSVIAGRLKDVGRVRSDSSDDLIERAAMQLKLTGT